MSKRKRENEIRNKLFEERLGISDESNPWGDSNLSTLHVWKKKEVSEGIGGKLPTEVDIQSETLKTIAELEAVKRRREDREIEQKILEDQNAMLSRERELKKFYQWKKKEADFLRTSRHQRAEIRSEQDRQEFIDYIIIGIHILEDPQYKYQAYQSEDLFQSILRMDGEDLDTLAKDLLLHLGPEALPIDRKYFVVYNAVGILVEEAKKKKQIDTDNGDKHTGLPRSVQQKIDAMLEQKDMGQLDELEDQVKNKLTLLKDGDPTYWEHIESRIPIFKGIKGLQQFQRSVIAEFEERKHKSPSSKSKVDFTLEPESTKTFDFFENTKHPQLVPTDKPKSERPEVDESELFVLIKYDDLHANAVLIDPVEDLAQRLELKKKIGARMRTRFASGTSSFAFLESLKLADPQTQDKDFEIFVTNERKDLGPDDMIMTEANEEKLPPTEHNWQNKFLPRKPRYFNRVKTGYEWNKYNQTHYDHENPPPRQVIGYKFNIFYPDLVDKIKSPEWKLEKSDILGTVIIRFKAGPPYEDIAFHILNREWDLNRNKGFKSIFDRGILQLYFNLKRYRYRR